MSRTHHHSPKRRADRVDRAESAHHREVLSKLCEQQALEDFKDYCEALRVLKTRVHEQRVRIKRVPVFMSHMARVYFLKAWEQETVNG